MTEKGPSLMNDCMCGNCKNCWNHLAKLERNKTLADVLKIIDDISEEYQLIKYDFIAKLKEEIKNLKEVGK